MIRFQFSCKLHSLCGSGYYHQNILAVDLIMVQLFEMRIKCPHGGIHSFVRIR